MSGPPTRSIPSSARMPSCSNVPMTSSPPAIGREDRSSIAATMRVRSARPRRCGFRCVGPGCWPNATSGCGLVGTTRSWPDWNGLMIGALANAGVVFDTPRWTEAAVEAFRFVSETMSEGGRLKHSWRAGRLKHTATLDDYANMADAAIALSEVTGERRYLDAAEAWVAILDRTLLGRNRRRLFLHRGRRRGTHRPQQERRRQCDAVGQWGHQRRTCQALLPHRQGQLSGPGRSDHRSLRGEVARNFFPSPRYSTATNCSCVQHRSSSSASAAMRAPRRFDTPPSQHQYPPGLSA